MKINIQATDNNGIKTALAFDIDFDNEMDVVMSFAKLVKFYQKCGWKVSEDKLAELDSIIEEYHGEN